MKTEYNSVSEDEIVKTKKEKKSVKPFMRFNFFDLPWICITL